VTVDREVIPATFLSSGQTGASGFLIWAQDSIFLTPDLHAQDFVRRAA
jgi:hypothetical protein